ncbi:MAG: V-type ATP synthase subunit D [Promethearchaeota archaeon]|nr:MAG: V-type ATP synthase subunit D [Candidatus Lokiarchaeota archaeon]
MLYRESELTISFKEVKPTKTNLINLQKRLEFASKGENYLEFKRDQLRQNIMDFWPKYQDHRSEFLKIFRKAMIKLTKTYEEMNKSDFIMISKLSKIQYKPGVSIVNEKKAGVIVSNILFELKRKEKLPAYSFMDTSHYIDDLVDILKDFFDKLIEYAQYEDMGLKYSLNYKKINRRINGLKEMIIPNLKSEIKNIKDIIEENERENFVRLKKTKDMIQKKENSI